jgi:hypothetical protein
MAWLGSSLSVSSPCSVDSRSTTLTHLHPASPAAVRIGYLGDFLLERRAQGRPGAPRPGHLLGAGDTP